MNKNTGYAFLALAVIAIGLVIVFWNKIKTKVTETAQTAADAVGGLPGLPAKKQFNAGDVVDSTTNNLKFRSSPSVNADNIIGMFNANQPVGQVIAGTDANGWVKVERYSPTLEQEAGYVYSAYLKLAPVVAQNSGWGSGAGGSW